MTSKLCCCNEARVSPVATSEDEGPSSNASELSYFDAPIVVPMHLIEGPSNLNEASSEEATLPTPGGDRLVCELPPSDLAYRFDQSSGDSLIAFKHH
jgi:hypothetical protein